MSSNCYRHCSSFLEIIGLTSVAVLLYTQMFFSCVIWLDMLTVLRSLRLFFISLAARVARVDVSVAHTDRVLIEDTQH